jgi:NAD(P)-dependent dehydrogenase (short-subunit alcohol dehydrogenase family)
MNAPLRAELVGPASVLRDRVTDALRQAGWQVAGARSPEDTLDLGVFVPRVVPSASLSTISPYDWWSRVHESLTAAFRCAKELTPRLSASAGALVFVSSLLGEIGAPGQTALSAAAAGMIGLVKALTLDVPSVRFGAVAPAWPLPEKPWHAADVDWRAMDVPRTATDVASATANAVVFLANDKEGHLRGQVIRIPSGVTR